MNVQHHRLYVWDKEAPEHSLNFQGIEYNGDVFTL
jgi:hypothetical protein